MARRGSISPRELAARNGEKILVVDDDHRVVDLLQITLSGRGFNVVTATHGEEALRRLTGARPDLVVMDTTLPRRNGLEVLAEIRKTAGVDRTPVILISSNTSSEAKLEGFRRGADDYVAKPFSPRELILRIRRILDRVEENQNLARRVRELEMIVARGEKALEESRADLRSRLFRVGSVISALQEVGQSRSLDDILTRVVTITVGYMDLEVAGLFLRDEAGDFVCRELRGPEAASRRHLGFSGQGAIPEALGDDKRALSLEMIETLPELTTEVAPLRSAGIRYLYPIVTPDGLAGAIAVGGASADPGGAEGDLIRAVARSVSVALTNQSAVETLQQSFLETSSLLIRSLEAHHTGLEGHTDRVANSAIALARRHGLSDADVDTVRLGAQLHDLGLVEIYEYLDRPTRELEPSAREKLTSAPARAATTIAETGPLARVAAVVRCHHEHWDGTGYPEGLGGESIPIGARIVAIANAFDAMLHERPYRAAMGPSDAIETLNLAAGREFDPELVDAFVQLVTEGEVPVG